MTVVVNRDLLHPHVVDESPAHDRARRLLVRPHAWSQEELSGEVRSLVETQELQWHLARAQDPAREEAGVLTVEAVLATGLLAHVAEAVADDEGAAVQHTQSALRQARGSLTAG